MYLIDTHAFLWFLLDDAKLPPEVKDIIQRSEDLSISIASFWEMAIKAGKGKLILPASITEMMNDCEEFKIKIVPITSRHLEIVQMLPDFHGDPFDRLILSQAMANGQTILSADEKFDQYGVKIFWK